MAESEPIINSCDKVKTNLNWKVKNQIERVHGFIDFDTACIRPILTREKVRKLRIPVHQRQQAVQILDATGGARLGVVVYFTQPLGIIVAKHEKTLSWEVSPLPKDVPHYFLNSWISIQNPDINWQFGTLPWRSNYCWKYSLPSEIVVTGIRIEELLLEDPSNNYQVGAAIYHDESGRNIVMPLPQDYCNWADIFSQEST